MTTSNPMTLHDALVLFEPTVSAKAFDKLQSTLRLYILKSFTFRGSAKTKLEDYPQRILLQDFAVEAPNYLAASLKQAEQEGKNPKTLANDRSNFNKLMNFLLSQSWYSKVAVLKPIPKRAPRLRAGISLADLHRGRRNFSANPYSLKESQLTAKLQQQIDRLHHYATDEKVPARKGKKIREVSWQSYREHFLYFLGWLKHEVEFSFDDLDLTLMADPSILKDYTNWHLHVRGNGYRHTNMICCAGLLIAKCFEGQRSKLPYFADCPSIVGIRSLQAEFAPYIKDDRRTTSPEAFDEKLLELEQCWECVDFLRQCCAERDSRGRKRSHSAVVDSWQDYLIVAILTYTPVRQSEIRSLMLGGNLKRKADGWWVKLKPTGHKTGSKTNKSREYPLFPGSMREQLTQDLDDYVAHIRPTAQLKHQYLFFMTGSRRFPEKRGEPIPDENRLSQSIPGLMLRVSALLFKKENAKSPSPHDFRRMFCTWIFTYGTAHEQEVYAELMGHSVEEARRTYALVKSSRITMQADDAFDSTLRRQQQMEAKFA